ncbi:hypothetical protein EZS27_041017, partial [termite gut metagenome]
MLFVSVDFKMLTLARSLILWNK